METNPEGTAQTYIFLVDNQDIALNIVMSGYQALCLVQEDDGYYFSADSFIEEMRAIQFTGSCQSAYHYVTACTVKWMNDKLQTFFKDAGLDGKAGWQLFKEKEYLGKLDNQKEVEKLLEQYILRFERNPKEEPELSRFHLFDAKGNVKGVRDMEIVDYLVENVQFFVVGITPYYYEHGVFLEDHDGVRMKSRIQKLLRQLHDLLAVSPSRRSAPHSVGETQRHLPRQRVPEHIIITGDFFPLFRGLRASKQDPVASLFDETHHGRFSRDQRLPIPRRDKFRPHSLSKKRRHVLHGHTPSVSCPCREECLPASIPIFQNEHVLQGDPPFPKCRPHRRNQRLRHIRRLLHLSRELPQDPRHLLKLQHDRVPALQKPVLPGEIHRGPPKTSI